MVEIRVVATTLEGTVVETITDSRGRYTMPAATPDTVSLSIILAHTSETGNSFAVMNGPEIISLTAPVNQASSGCEINFDS
jgi:phosphatidate phosphatase APP1